MKKLLIILSAIIFIGCDNKGVTSENGSETVNEDLPAGSEGSDSTSIHTDTTMSGGMNRQNQYDTLK